MTNHEAVLFVKQTYPNQSGPQRLARLFAIQDIIDFDVEFWVNTPVYEHLEQFVKHGTSVAEEHFEDSMQTKEHQRKFMEATLNISESMVKYAQIHHDLKKRSER